MQPLSLLGPLDALGTNVTYLVFGLAIANVGTRLLAHRQHARQAERSDDAEALTRHPLHQATNVLLLLSAFYMATVAYHGGTVMSMLAMGLVITDFFEFEARKVEARKGDPLDRPNGALTASLLLVGYASYQALYFLIEGLVARIIVV
ncbi:MAG: hypothetical protein V5A23_08165 [Halobacteriales archaeon]